MKGSFEGRSLKAKAELVSARVCTKDKDVIVCNACVLSWKTGEDIYIYGGKNAHGQLIYGNVTTRGSHGHVIYIAFNRLSERPTEGEATNHNASLTLRFAFLTSFLVSKAMSHLPVFIGDVSAVLSTRGIHACVVDTLALILHNVPRALGPVKFAVHERDLDRATAALTSKHTGILYKAVPHPSWDWMHSYTAYTRHFQVTTAPPGTLYGSAHEEVTLVSAEWLEIRLDQESTLLHSDQIQGVLYPTLSSLLCSLLSMFHREEDLRGHCMMDIDYLVHHNPQLDDSWLAAHIPPDVPGREIIARQANKRERRKRTDIKAQRDDSEQERLAFYTHSFHN